MHRPLLLLLLAFICVPALCSAQAPSAVWLARKLDSLDRNKSLGYPGKLALLVEWKGKADAEGTPRDSVYARLLHRIGAFEFSGNSNYNAAILHTLGAMQINTAGKPGASVSSAVTDLFNLGLFYDKISLFGQALLYYDSAIRLTRRTPDIHEVVLDSRLNKAYIFFRMGDYQKAVEESDLGIAGSLQKNDSLHYLYFLSQRGQSLFYQNEWEAALRDVRTAIPLARRFHKDFDMATAFKTRALVFARQREFEAAKNSFDSCIAERIISKAWWQVAGDYSDFGIFYGDSLRSYGRAAGCFSTAIGYARKAKDSTRLARISLNLGRNYFHQQKFGRTMDCYGQAMHYLKIGTGVDPMANPCLEQLIPIGNKELIQLLFNSKTELLLKMFEVTGERKWLTACLRTARLNDSLIRDIRHEQLGEQSKLYWRNKTRGFFMDAMEACYFAGDAELAFYFMEESRSVLLQDKLNELGANALLPPAETAKQDSIRVILIDLQEKLASVPDSSAAFASLRVRLSAAREELERQIRSLEQRFPNYYQYKYADKAPSLSALQNFLGQWQQEFIETFTADTINFALYVTPRTARFIKIGGKAENIENLFGRWLRACSDETAMARDFDGWLKMSHDLYRILVEPFHLKGRRVIVCQENYLLPFEALSKSASAPDFLIRDHAFSYVYSAHSLMTPFPDLPAKGDFLGVAPIHFGVDRGLPELRQSEQALRQCSRYYQRSHLLVDEEASRGNFLRSLDDYTVTTILTHARADSSGDEPRLFLRDSMILLSELQLVNKAATRLIVLSACQTNVGMNQHGEGIFSLARGFSAAGIPSVAATQWEADEQAIYAITEKFNEFIAQEMNKDEALQKAKLYYMEQAGNGNKLPYYWADMILIGNAEPVRFAPQIPWTRRPLVEVLVLVTVVMLGLWALLRRRRRK